MSEKALQELEAEIAYWTEQHRRGKTEAHFAAFGIATGLKLAKSILLGEPYSRGTSDQV